jgi:gliding motility-associated-like protein
MTLHQAGRFCIQGIKTGCFFRVNLCLSNHLSRMIGVSKLLIFELFMKLNLPIFFLSILFNGLVLSIFGQGAATNWYFGLRAGIRFENLEPNTLLDSEMRAFEGCTSYSSESGNLLFYSNGDTVWNRNHQPMPNGTGLQGHPSATQSVAFCQLPNSNSKYLIFTTDGFNLNVGLRYSVIDMDLDGGLGDIVFGQKNIIVLDSVTEKLGIIEKCDKTGYWVITNQTLGNTIFTFSIDSNGLDTNANISQGQISYSSLGAKFGYLRISSKGNYVALCHEMNHKVELFQFDNQTGLLSNPIVIQTPNLINFPAQSKPYGAEFSPNEELLYITPRNGFDSYIAQYNISIYDSTTIKASEFILKDSIWTGALQLGPNGHIYGSSLNHLFEIENPNEIGSAANLIESAVYLGGRPAYDGLPNFINSEVIPPIPNLQICFGDSIAFDYEQECAISYFWNFDDPGSGSTNTSSLSNPVHTFSDTGSFNVQLIVQYPTLSDTFSNIITVVVPPAPSVLKDTTALCSSQPVYLSAFQLGAEYAWGNGSDSSAILVNDTGWYVCTISNACTTIIDSSFVRFVEPLTIDLGTDTFLCDSATIELNGVSAANVESVMWSTGDTSSATLEISHSKETLPSNFWLTATNACGTSSDTIRIEFLPQPDVSWFSDSILCEQSEAIVNAPTIDSVTFFMTYTTDDIAYDTLAQPWIIDTFGLYYMHAFNQCDTVVKRAFLSPFNVINVSLGADTVLCPGDVIKLDAFWPSSSYVWSDESTDSILVVSHDDLLGAGSETYSVTITNGACQRTASRSVSIEDLLCDTSNCKFSIPNVFSPNADGINDVLKISNTCSSVSFSVAIYNRWGQLIFSDERAQGNSPFTWDGFINGIAAAEGTYFIIIQYEDKVQKGSFSLVR